MVGAASAGLPRYLNPSDSLRLRRCRLRGGTIRARGRASRVEGLVDELAALHDIFLVNERAQFEFAVTNASLREVVARDEPGFTQWVHDVLDTWLIQSAGESVIPSCNVWPIAVRQHQRQRSLPAPGCARRGL